MTYTVWILLAYLGSCWGANCAHGGPVVIDNIATKEECQRLHPIVTGLTYDSKAICIEVIKKK